VDLESLRAVPREVINKEVNITVALLNNQDLQALNSK